MATNKSTRLNIVEQAVIDILERLGDVEAAVDKPATTVKLRELRTKALAYERTVKGWLVHPPSEAQRSTMLKLVLELNMQVMQFARDEATASGTVATAPNAAYVPKSLRTVKKADAAVGADAADGSLGKPKSKGSAS